MACPIAYGTESTVVVDGDEIPAKVTDTNGKSAVEQLTVDLEEPISYTD